MNFRQQLTFRLAKSTLLLPAPLEILLFRKMTKVVIYLSVGFMLFFWGWFVGYTNGAYNQSYYDSVAKIHLYEAALKAKEGPRSVLKAYIFGQICNLSYVDANFPEFTLYHPAHNVVRKYYKSNIDGVCGEIGCHCDEETLKKFQDKYK